MSMHMRVKSKDQKTVAAESQTKETVPSFPHLVFIELLAIMVVMLFFILISIYYNAPLEEMANLSETPNPAKAPWYFVGLQELLTYFDPWIGGVIIPLLIIFGLMFMPFFSNSRGEGRFHRPHYPRIAVIIFTGGLALWFILIVIGQFFRGPSWLIYWPWESWNIEKEFKEELWSFSYASGMALLITYFALALVMPAVKWRDFYKRLGMARYSIFMILLSLFVGVILKIMLRLIFGVKYILTTPWFNI